MSLILFTKDTTFMDRYVYKSGTTYEVPERLRVKFCNQVGVATEVQKEDGVEVQPNPSAEMYDGEDLVSASAKPAPKPEVASEPEPAPKPEVASEPEPAPSVDLLYELKKKGGPWWNVVDIAIGTEMNDKPLKKADAEVLLAKLNANTGSSED